MNGRGSSARLWDRVCDLVVLADADGNCNREILARRWNCTTRNVSHVINHAESQYGVQIEWHRSNAGDSYYRLMDCGVLDLSEIKRRNRRHR